MQNNNNKIIRELIYYRLSPFIIKKFGFNILFINIMTGVGYVGYLSYFKKIQKRFHTPTTMIYKIDLDQKLSSLRKNPWEKLESDFLYLHIKVIITDMLKTLNNI